MKKTVLLACLLLLPVLLTACNTVEGVGEDLTASGRAIDRAANDAR